ncbi:MAG TPA: hypothetical protein VK654_00855, partial [Nitrospirota bacterium]|nr:hypothetical protein [Nitrospirota bacterium]
TIGGLMVSTFLTLLYVPIFYTVFEDGLVRLKRATALRRLFPQRTAAEASGTDNEKRSSEAVS